MFGKASAHIRKIIYDNPLNLPPHQYAQVLYEFTQYFDSVVIDGFAALSAEYNKIIKKLLDPYKNRRDRYLLVCFLHYQRVHPDEIFKLVTYWASKGWMRVGSDQFTDTKDLCQVLKDPDNPRFSKIAHGFETWRLDHPLYQEQAMQNDVFYIPTDIVAAKQATNLVVDGLANYEEELSKKKVETEIIKASEKTLNGNDNAFEELAQFLYLGKVNERHAGESSAIESLNNHFSLEASTLFQDFQNQELVLNDNARYHTRQLKDTVQMYADETPGASEEAISSSISTIIENKLEQAQQKAMEYEMQYGGKDADDFEIWTLVPKSAKTLNEASKKRIEQNRKEAIERRKRLKKD